MITAAVGILGAGAVSAAEFEVAELYVPAVGLKQSAQWIDEEKFQAELTLEVSGLKELYKNQQENTASENGQLQMENSTWDGEVREAEAAENTTDEVDSENTECESESAVIDIEDIGKIKYETEKTEEEISEKYLTGKEKYEIKGEVKAGETEGKVIYVREDYEKINVYKTEYNLNKYTDKSMQIDNIIEEFETICKEYMEMTETEYEESEKVYGEIEAKFELPIEESIYDEGRVYSKTYKNEEKEYDINYYRKDNKIVCEFVKIM